MANHKLSMSIIRTLNSEVILLLDTSIYSDGLPVECPLLEVTVPGFSSSAQITDLESGFYRVVTACDLDLNSGDCSNTVTNLPDGVYVFHYSVSPNASVRVEYNHLRTTRLDCMYNEKLCELDISDCEPSDEVRKKMLLMDEISVYMRAAIAQVEVCHNPGKGMQLYNYAKKLLQRMDCKNCS